MGGIGATAPADGGSEMQRGWKIILTAAFGVGLGMSPLPIYSLGVFTKPIAAEFGWGRGEVQAVLAFFTLGALIGAPTLGAVMDRKGVRPVVLVSTALWALGFMAIGLLTNTKVTFYALGFLSALLGSGTLPVTWSRAIFDWFVVRRGFALGLALTGTGFAAFLVPPFATWLVAHGGWRMGYVGLGALPLLIALPLSFALLKPAPASATKLPRGSEPGYTLGQALRGYRFYVIAVGFFLVSLGTGGVVTHIVPMLTDRGYDVGTAALVAGAQGLAVVFGRAITGYLIDRLWAPAVACFIFLLPAASCLILSAGVSDVAIATAAVILVGFAGGAEFDLIAYMSAKYFGMRHFGLVYGLLYSLFVSASGLAPGLFGHAYDVTGSYRLILEVAAVCFVVGACLALTLGRYPTSLPSPAPTR